MRKFHTYKPNVESNLFSYVSLSLWWIDDIGFAETPWDAEIIQFCCRNSRNRCEVFPFQSCKNLARHLILMLAHKTNPFLRQGRQIRRRSRSKQAKNTPQLFHGNIKRRRQISRNVFSSRSRIKKPGQKQIKQRGKKANLFDRRL